jgi:Na+-translocating ferredoxin:NAD+ oxidoreductase RnfG subunit
MGHNRWTLDLLIYRQLGLGIGVIAATITSLPLHGQTRLTQEEALRLAFPEPATIQRQTAFLTEDHLDEARSLAAEDVEISSSVVTYYVARSNGAIIGVAYFDAHRVRTLPEVLMIVLTPSEEVDRIEVLKFSEPPEYQAPERWFELFYDQRLTDDLSLKGRIVNITGATLTSKAVTASVRRVLALNQVIDPLDRGER